MNIYDANKEIYQNAPPMKEEDIKKIIFNYFLKHNSQYFLILNHDIRYYTLFHTHNFNSDTITKEVYSIIHELGPIVDIINNQEIEMLEIWIKYDGKPIMFGLFDYTRGVVEI